MSAIDVAVLVRLRSELGEDHGVMHELANAFFAQSPRLLADAHVGASKGERERLVRAAHTLKSSASTFGALRLVQLSRELEAEAMRGIVPDAAARVAALEAEYGAVERDLRAWLAGGHQK